MKLPKQLQVLLPLGLISVNTAFTQLSLQPFSKRSCGNVRNTLSKLGEKESATIEATNSVTLDGNGKKKINRQALEFLNNCASATQARRILEKELLHDNKDSKGQALYKSISVPPGASAKGISDGDLAIQTRLANKKYKIMELIELNGDRDIDRASVGVFSVTVASVLSALTVNQNLPGPEIIRFFLVWVLTFAPLAFVGYGLKDAEKLQAGLVSIQRNVFPAYRKRMIQHEAGHFLMGHLLGWPVKGYQTNAVKNAVEFYPLADTDRGRDFARQLGFDKPSTPRDNEIEEPPRRVEDVPFFSKQGSGGLLLDEQSVFRKNKNYTDNPFLKLPSQNEPSNSWPYRGFDDSTLDQLTMISLGGICAEILAFGNAEGGLADLSQLKQLFNSADEEINEREADNRIRYAIGYTMSQLRRHLGALDDLAEVMERGGSVAECIIAIENCKNPSGQDGFSSDYELRRREKFRSEGIPILERVFLGGDRNIDTVEDRLVVGKGGGDKKETFRLTGDDPLYLALGVSIAFLTWASSGGLSLH